MDLSGIVIAVVSSTVLSAAVTGIITWIVQTNALEQAKLTETMRLFAELMALGHSRDTSSGRKDPVGRSEMLGALQMIAAVGVAYKPLKSAARAYLQAHKESFGVGGTAADAEVEGVVDAALVKLK